MKTRKQTRQDAWAREAERGESPCLEESSLHGPVRVFVRNGVILPVPEVVPVRPAPVLDTALPRYSGGAGPRISARVLQNLQMGYSRTLPRTPYG